jgi:hypothetical protein
LHVKCSVNQFTHQPKQPIGVKFAKLLVSGMKALRPSILMMVQQCYSNNVRFLQQMVCPAAGPTHVLKETTIWLPLATAMAGTLWR